MRFMTRPCVELLFGVVALIGLSVAATNVHAQEADEAGPVVVELFMSQSCSSCVSASEYLHELAARDDVVALNWHVDYWNMLNTKHGRWIDPYSQRAYTDRQRRYNKNIRHKSSVYTPQIIVGGAVEAPGSSRAKVSTAIDSIRAQQPMATVEAQRVNNEIIFDIGESDSGGNAYLISLHPNIETDVPRGENAGRTLKEVNIVTGVRPLGIVRRIGTQLAVPAPGGDQTCALIVQEPRQGHIIAASYCPDSR